MNLVKEINIKNRTYYFFDDMINIKNFDSNQTLCSYVKSNSANPLYFIIDTINEYIEESNGNI